MLLKTKLSALTAGMVMLILGGLSIKLWFIWGLLTFAFNFIPNVGSLIAMVLPVPVRCTLPSPSHSLIIN